MPAPVKERARSKARANKKAKPRGGPATLAVEKGKNWLPPQQWTQVQPWLHPEAVEPLEARKIRKARAKAQTSLTDKDVCPS